MDESDITLPPSLGERLGDLSDEEARRKAAEAFLGPQGDPKRAHQVALTDVTHEREALDGDRSDLIARLQDRDGAYKTPEVWEHLRGVTRAVVEADADRIDIERDPPGDQGDK